MVTYRKRKVFMCHLLHIRSAKIIQRKFRLYRQNKIIRSFMILLNTLKSTVRHIMLFGTRKAFHAIREFEFNQANSAEKIAIGKLISASHHRKRAKV